VKRRAALWFLLAAALAAGGCGRAASKPRTDLPAADQMTLGQRAIEDGDNYEAQQLLKGYLEREPSGERADEAHYLLGLSFFRTGEWPSAATEFVIVVNQFADSPRVPDAQYHLGLAYWKQARGAAFDQDYTRLALGQFDRFLSIYPDHPQAGEIRGLRAQAEGRLAKKDYENGRLYLKMGFLDAARFYFREVQKSYPGTEWAQRSVLGEARSWIKAKRWAQAVPPLEALLAVSPPEPIAAEARRLLAEAQRGAGAEATP
jgi:outer membrane protein assembly factor BamD